MLTTKVSERGSTIKPEREDTTEYNKGQQKGFGKGYPKLAQKESLVHRPRTAKGEPIYMGFCATCGEQGRSAKFCPTTHPVGTPQVYHGECPSAVLEGMLRNSG